jgi:hypothetical protein
MNLLKKILPFFGVYPAPERIGISCGDYEGFIQHYAWRVRVGRPLTLKRERCLINLLDMSPGAPLTSKQEYELINLENLEELLDPRDPRFRTHQDIDMRFWVSPKAGRESCQIP